MSTPRNVIHRCPRCSRDVSALFPFCQHFSRYVNTLFPLCQQSNSRYVNALFPSCQHAVPVMSATGNVTHHCPRCARCANALFTRCQQSVQAVNVIHHSPRATPLLQPHTNTHWHIYTPTSHPLRHTPDAPPPPRQTHTHTLKSDKLVMIYDALL